MVYTLTLEGDPDVGVLLDQAHEDVGVLLEEEDDGEVDELLLLVALYDLGRRVICQTKRMLTYYSKGKVRYLLQ
jgi:hypothetical protein